MEHTREVQNERLAVPARQTTRARTWTGDREWYTPPHIIQAAASVMGAIDLDPATSDAQQALAPIKAKSYFTMQHSGLEQPWRGRVFLNPPYARGWIDLFVNKMIADYVTGTLVQGILLTNSSTETKWWQRAATHCDALCLVKGRVRFLKVVNGALTRGSSSPSHPHSIFYFGDNAPSFVEMFREFGLVAAYPFKRLP